jgi:hypothetical protein
MTQATQAPARPQVPQGQPRAPLAAPPAPAETEVQDQVEAAAEAPVPEPIDELEQKFQAISAMAEEIKEDIKEHRAQAQRHTELADGMVKRLKAFGIEYEEEGSPPVRPAARAAAPARRTAPPARTAPARPAAATARRPAPRGRNQERLPAKQLALEYLNEHGEARAKDIRAHFENNGVKSNPSVVLSRLCTDGEIEKTEDGTYAIIERR